MLQDVFGLLCSLPGAQSCFAGYQPGKVTFFIHGWNLVSRPSHSVVEMLGNWFSKCFFHCAGLVDGGDLVQCCGAEQG